ncbi:MAG: hypothetical protein VW338_08635 [Rhodospirillaceae bacterium]
MSITLEPITANVPTTDADDAFAIPQEDLALLANLPAKVREEVHDKLHALRWMHGEANKTLAAKTMAAHWSGRRGFSAKSLRTLYYAVLSEGWRAAVDRKKAGAHWMNTDKATLPAATIQHWKSLCERNQRKCKPAHRALIRQWVLWRNGDITQAVPGYKVPPAPEPATGLPSGWTYKNLIRHRPSNFELTAARIGRTAAAKHRPGVYTTRVGLAVGEVYQFDDMWHDFQVAVLGQKGARRLLQFHCLDLFSGCNIARGCKPVLENEETGKMEHLKEAEMLFLVAHILGTMGYRSQGTTLVVEHGTAAIRPEQEELIARLTNGKVTVARSGIGGQSAHAGFFNGASKGNFKFKAALESLGNLIHNETADALLLPGQTGSMAQLNKPEELVGRDRYHKTLMKAMAALPAERAAKLKLPFVEFNEAVWIVEEIMDRINKRTDHDLEGWQEAGLTRTEIRTHASLPWMDSGRLLELPEQKRAATLALCDTRVRKLSPFEVWSAGQKQLQRLPDHSVALLLGTKFGREVTVRKHLLEFNDATIAPAPLRYDATQLPDGEKFNVVVNPMQPDKAHLFNAKGAYLGAVARWQTVSRKDEEGLRRAMGQALKAEAELLKPVALRGAKLIKQRLEMHQHNAAVLAGGPLTIEEKQHAKKKQQALQHIPDASEFTDNETEETQNHDDAFDVADLL